MRTRHITVVVTACFIFFFSCKKNASPNDGDKTTNTSLLVGKWYYMQDTVLEYKNGTLSRIVNEESSATIDPVYFMQFNSDATGVASNESGSVNFTYTLNGNKLTTSFAASRSGGEVVPAHTDVPTVKILTSGRLELFYDDSDTFNGDVIRNTEAAYYIKK